jgi:hypothetical protein
MTSSWCSETTRIVVKPGFCAELGASVGDRVLDEHIVSFAEPVPTGVGGALELATGPWALANSCRRSRTKPSGKPGSVHRGGPREWVRHVISGRGATEHRGRIAASVATPLARQGVCWKIEQGLPLFSEPLPHLRTKPQVDRLSAARGNPPIHRRYGPPQRLEHPGTARRGFPCPSFGSCTAAVRRWWPPERDHCDGTSTVCSVANSAPTWGAHCPYGTWICLCMKSGGIVKPPSCRSPSASRRA